MGDNRGLVLVFTGDGKGKTTAALGLALRAWGQGMRVLVIQFIKGDVETGELKAAARLEGLEIRPLGAGFVYPGREKALDRHREAAVKALSAARAALEGRGHEMVVLDEIFCALNLGLVMVDEVLALLAQKPEDVHLVLTGRGAPPEILARADLVTEMRELKHHYRNGVGAQRGIEY
ncbi:MAG: cob(I)yrinic acid a,c-diamide adenosyltransferase [Bacillota bacterium]